MTVVLRARAARIVALGAATLVGVACSYEFGGAGFGGEGGTLGAGSGVYTSDVSTSPAGVTGPTGGPTTAPSSVASVVASSVDVASSSTGIPTVCGDGIIEGGETCDGDTAGFGAFCFGCSLCKGGRYEAEVGRCYFYAPTNDGQSEADAACNEHWIQGASLAQPIDDMQRTAMNRSVPAGGDLVYIGLKRQGSAYAWTDGAPAANPPWAALQPVESLDCVAAQEFLGGYYWLTAECPNVTDLVRGYVCEWKPPPS